VATIAKFPIGQPIQLPKRLTGYMNNTKSGEIRPAMNRVAQLWPKLGIDDLGLFGEPQ
jgi:hypothetical protein